jgi:hypothetical protein
MDLVVLQVADRIAFAPPSNIPHGLAHQAAQFGFGRDWIATVEKLGTSPLNEGRAVWAAWAAQTSSQGYYDSSLHRPLLEKAR